MEISKGHGEACSGFDPHLKVHKCPDFALYLLPEDVSGFLAKMIRPVCMIYSKDPVAAPPADSTLSHKRINSAHSRAMWKLLFTSVHMLQSGSAGSP